MNRKVLKWRFVLAVGALVLLAAVAGCDSGASQAPDDVGPLRLGLLLNFSEGAPAKAKDRQRAFDLAVKHVNQGGGVFGRPVEVVGGTRRWTRQGRWRRRGAWLKWRAFTQSLAPAPAPTR